MSCFQAIDGRWFCRGPASPTGSQDQADLNVIVIAGQGAGGNETDRGEDEVNVDSVSNEDAAIATGVSRERKEGEIKKVRAEVIKLGQSSNAVGSGGSKARAYDDLLLEVKRNRA